jgi:prolyl oligopeptidase
MVAPAGTAPPRSIRPRADEPAWVSFTRGLPRPFGWCLFLCSSSPLALAACAITRNDMEPSQPKPPAAQATASVKDPQEDPYLWLEEVIGEEALTWVHAQNRRSLHELGTPEQIALKHRLLAIYDSKDRIPHVSKRGKLLYNFWRDEKHVRGLWRRTTLESYREKAPSWETVLDVDALARKEHENWVYQGASCLRPKYERCLLQLSRGGGDAVVVRELDTRKKEFVADGFTLPEAKSSVSWKDEDTIYVGTDFGPGSLTNSGYPRIVKEWKRGTPLRQAKILFEGQATDVSIRGFRHWHQGRFLDVIVRAIGFYESETFLLEEGKPVQLDHPRDADVSFFREFVLLRLRSDWTVAGKTWPSGALLAVDLKAYRAGKRDLEMLYEPGKNHSLSDYSGTKSALLLNVLEDVRTELRVVRHEKGAFSSTVLPLPGLGNYSAFAFDDEEDDRYLFGVGDFLAPARLELGDLASGKLEPLKSEPAFFQAEGLDSRQFFAVSRDGTRIPYFQIASKELALDGCQPVLLTGYGGFEISLLPRYDPSVGAAWLEAGGVHVVANIRGGGEYGPAWHQAGVKKQRQRIYDDFIAVAEDLIKRKVTQPSKLGIEGGSNGGLLMGVMFTQRPDLWGAVVCRVPLLDMRRYHKLLAGASWIDEYGDPDKPDEWEAIARYSPYHNVKKDACYPRILFTTSTRDDRVHPGHARKMVARMLEQGHDILYYENTEGGHAGAANNPQRANLEALEFTYLKNQLMIR